MKNCQTCRKFTKCKHPEKSYKFVCDDFKKIKMASEDDLAKIFTSAAKPKVTDKFANLDSKQETEALMDLNVVLDEIFADDNPIARDLHIDDSDVPTPKNFFDFCYNLHYGLAGNKPFPRQLWIYSKLFAEICPRCTKKKYFNNMDHIPVDMKPEKFLSKVQLLDHGVCPACGGQRHKMFKRGKLPIYHELAMLAGQRSGKSISVSFGFSYILCRALKLQAPAQVYTGLNNQQIAGTVTSLSLTNVMTLLWQPILDLIEDSKWFKQYFEVVAHYEEKYGQELVRIKDTYIRFLHRKILLAPEVPNKRKLRGKTRFVYSIDELGWFDEGADKITVSGEETWTSLDRSCATARQSAYQLWRQGYNNVMPAFGLNISSPSSMDDKCTKLVYGNRDSKTVLAIQAATWEINPGYTRESPLIVQAYKDNPINADRDYGAIPPSNANPFFNNSKTITESFKKNSNRVEYTESTERSKTDHNKIYVVPKILSYNTAGLEHSTIIAIDAGYSNNSFGLAVMHKEMRPTGVKDEKQKVFVVDAAIELMPDFGKTVVNHAKVFDRVIRPLVEQFGVTMIAADRWQSLALLHGAEELEGIQETVQYSLKYSDFIMFRSLLQEAGAIEFPKMEISEKSAITPNGEYPECFRGLPVAHLRHQLATVVDTGRTVDKGSNKRTDDLVRAIVLGATILDSKKYADNFKGTTKINSYGFAALAGGGVSGSNVAHDGYGIAHLS